MQDWLRFAIPAAEQALADPANAAQWQCEGTWFLGLDALNNDAQGRIGQGPALSGAAVTCAAAACGGLPPLHCGQLSVMRSGYPRPRAGESAAGFRYRAQRDAAHVDGLHAVGSERRRYLREAHGFVLGIPLNEAGPDAAPLVVWEGSHEIMRAAFRSALQAHDPARWAEVDLTETYVAARKACFDACRRVPVRVPLGGAFVLHRLALHGVAPWTEPDNHPGAERRIAYFRPELPGGFPDWLNLP